MTRHQAPLPSNHHVLRPRRYRGIAATVGLVIALLVFAACSSSGGASSSDMSLTVTTPSDGAAVGRSFPVTVKANVPFGEPSTGRHHLHLYFDGNKNEGEYDIVYSKHTTVKGLTPGRHTIEAEIANPDHSGTGVTQTFSVTLGGTGAGTPPTTTSPTTPPSTSRPPSTSSNGYDY